MSKMIRGGFIKNKKLNPKLKNRRRVWFKSPRTIDWNPRHFGMRGKLRRRII